MITKKTLYLLGLVTLFGFSGISVLLLTPLTKRPLEVIFNSHINWFFQIIIGLVYGYVSARLAWLLVKSRLLAETRNFFARLIQQINMNGFDIIFISFCAGFGEEILFRGGIQYLLGIWITAILFVALHGYLNPWNWRLSVYGLLMCFIIAGMGLMKETIGIIASISAHFAIDWYLLKKLVSEKYR